MNELDFFTIYGHDAAIIGRCVSSGRYIYSMQKILNGLVFDHEMTHEDADEFFWYNIERSLSYLGEGAPIILDDITWEISQLDN